MKRKIKTYFYLLGGLLGLLLLIVLLDCSNLAGYFLYKFSVNSKLALTIQCNGGRLGNQMCTYATLFALSRLNNRPFLPLTCNVDHLTQHFAGLSQSRGIPPWLYLKSHSWEVGPFLRPEDNAIPMDYNIIEGYQYPCSYTFFEHVRSSLKQEFRFKPELENHARKALLKVASSASAYVCVHVRRGDYESGWLAAFDGVAADIEYFRQALAHFRQRLGPNVVFVAVSDDRAWCESHLTGLGVRVAMEAPTPGHDMAVLAACNHTVMTYGTFGFWGAYLSGGEVVYFDKFLRPGTEFVRTKFRFDKMYPPHWTGIAANVNWTALQPKPT